MNPGDGDRNLLFGLIALQLDLIDQYQFVEACTAWSAQKHESLASVLCGRGWISTEERDDLERVLGRKLARHGGDSRQSLAAAVSGRIGGVPDDFADFEVRSVVTRISGVVPDDRIAPATTVSSPPETRRNFPLVRLHASGGMGRVWVARDPALGREVALKELLPGRASDPSLRARFIREARITGQLEHPNIVPIYELAQCPEGGGPFYTMRFIRGRRLTDAIREYHRDRQAGAMELNRLLNAFVAICNAVAYAHSRHVVHRDLKGQNVVLGDYGEVVLLDWGLAKVVHQPDEAASVTTIKMDDGEGLDLTLPGQLLGTPGYMAPEQAEGQGDSVGPISDVYGLGAILFEILTGQRPHRDSKIDEVLRLARDVGPTPARDICSSAPPALEAVCLKAMARKPEDRYASATELAREIQRWLADEPVSTYRDPALTRLGRWARRHRTAVVGAASLLLTATLALAIGTALIGRSYRSEADQRRRAESSFLLARDAVDHLFYGVLDDPLLREPRMDRLLRTSSRTALDFYAKLNRAMPGDRDLRYRLGLAYQRLATVTLRQGSASEAMEQARQALIYLTPLSRQDPSSVLYRRPLARALAKLAVAHHQLQRFGEAVDPFQQALDIARGVEQQTHDPADLDLVAEIMSGIADFRQIVGDREGAVSAYEEVLKICRQLLGDGRFRPDSTRVRLRMAASLAALGHLAQVMGNIDRAAVTLRQAKDELDDLVEEDPTTEHRYYAAQTDQSLGKLLGNSGDTEQAGAVFREARDLWSVLAQEYPDTPSYHWGYAATLQNLGDLNNPAFHPKSNPDVGRKFYETALEIWDREASRNRDRPLLGFERARTRFTLGQLYYKGQQRERARTYLSEARSIWEGLPPDTRGVYEREYRKDLLVLLAALEQAAPEHGPEQKKNRDGERPAP